MDRLSLAHYFPYLIFKQISVVSKNCGSPACTQSTEFTEPDLFRLPFENKLWPSDGSHYATQVTKQTALHHMHTAKLLLRSRAGLPPMPAEVHFHIHSEDRMCNVFCT